MNIFSLFTSRVHSCSVNASGKGCRTIVSLSLLWLCGCCGPGGFLDPCSVGPAYQPDYIGNDCTCGCCDEPSSGLFGWMRNRKLTQCPLRHFPKRKPFQSRRVIDDASYFSSGGRHFNRQCVDECCPITPTCVAPPTCIAPPVCVAPISCAVPEPCCVPDVCVPAPACAAPARCIEVPDCTAPVTCAVPSGCAVPPHCTNAGNYQFPQCACNTSDCEPGYMYEGDIYEPDLPAVWNQNDGAKIRVEEPIQLPAPKSVKKVKPSVKKKPVPKKVPAPPKKLLKERGAPFAPPLVPPTR